MKFICLGYYDEKAWESMPEKDVHAFMDECFAYDEVLRKGGHFAGGEALQPAPTARTISWKEGKAVVTEGPYAETKEVLGGILILEARDMAHAVELMSKHPGVKAGPFEIRPADDLSKMIEDSKKRLAARKQG
jgi:hypothetical protein